ncbi:GLPGLI family protein [Nonlabens xiamenensis]|uniref:GLPGLI family protein n=1 Tax=Nonlabens xiamenensis TaxID=2341043 RepID=UPI000F614A5B|nr:GLPGLI family protein [Nonlabens xiamenensis]
MKKFTRTICLLLVIAFAKAELSYAQQEITGIAHYKSKMIMEKSDDSLQKKMQKLDPEMQKMIASALENAGKAEFTLKFSRTESLYEKVQELAKPKPQSGMSISIEISGGGDTYGTTYKNLVDQTFIREDQIQGKEFLIVDQIKPLDWKLTGESKKIGNYTAMKATYTFPKEEKDEQEVETSLLEMAGSDERVITAWFTMDIPISNGPGNYQGLPGLILELRDGNTVILCDRIEMNPADFELEKPKKGKKIGLEDFNDLQAKKQKEMQERFQNKRSGDGVIFMKG